MGDRKITGGLKWIQIPIQERTMVFKLEKFSLQEELQKSFLGIFITTISMTTGRLKRQIPQFQKSSTPFREMVWWIIVFF